MYRFYNTVWIRNKLLVASYFYKSQLAQVFIVAACLMLDIRQLIFLLHLF